MDHSTAHIPFVRGSSLWLAGKRPMSRTPRTENNCLLGIRHRMSTTGNPGLLCTFPCRPPGLAEWWSPSFRPHRGLPQSSGSQSIPIEMNYSYHSLAHDTVDKCQNGKRWRANTWSLFRSRCKYLEFRKDWELSAQPLHILTCIYCSITTMVGLGRMNVLFREKSEQLLDHPLCQR